jgi:uncharacterized membrane protein YqhA
MEQNLAVSIYVRSSIKFLHFVPFHNKYDRQGQFLFLIVYSLKKSSPLKLLGKMEPNLAGSIYVISSIKLLHLVPFGQQTWPPRLILFFWLANVKNIISSETAWTNGAKHGRKHLYKVSKPGIDGTWVCPFQNCVWQPHPPFKMAAVFKVMIISLWNLLQYHSIVRWAIQAQWAEPLVCIRSFDHMTC